MKIILSIAIIFILINPDISSAQSTDNCSNFNREQIIDALKAHPEKKYNINYYCFDKLTYGDIKRIYGVEPYDLSLINDRRNLNRINTLGWFIVVPATIMAIISFGSIGGGRVDANYKFLGMGIAFSILDLPGLTLVIIGSNNKRKLYNELIKGRK